MCLIVDKYYHHYGGKNEGCLLTPLIAEEDITVFKVLSLRDGMITTPYQAMPVTFNDKGTFEYTAGFEWDDKEKGISCGCHAYSSFGRALMTSETFVSLYTYKAVIPKGSKFFIGKFGAIVSNRLIIHNERFYFGEPIAVFTLNDYIYKYIDKTTYLY